MSLHSRNALHVLRLVLQGDSITNRSFAAAALVREDERPLFYSYTAAFQDTSSTPLNFLEDASSLYDNAIHSLPLRSSARHEIPWPTVFAPKITKYNKHRPIAQSTYQPKPKICDPIHQLVLSNDYIAARRVHEEIVSAGYNPQHRKIYLDPALACLYAKTPDRQGFLNWMAIYPNRPATKSTLELESVWLPVVSHLKAKHTFELDFIADFVELGGKLGLLPIILDPLITHIVLLTPPKESFKIMQRTIKAYRSTTTSAESTSDRAVWHRNMAESQIAVWWNKYIRRLVIAGWKAETVEVLARMQSEGMIIPWHKKTREMLEELSGHSSRKAITVNSVVDPDVPLNKRIRAALTSPITPNQLATLINDLSPLSTSRPGLYARFKSRFIKPSKSIKRATPHPRSSIWLQAELIQFRRRDQNEEAVQHYLSNVLWIGLPDHPLQQKYEQADMKINLTRCHPTIHLITTILPSLVATLDDPNLDLPKFHQEYLSVAGTCPPALQPNTATNGTFIRHITHYKGGDAGLNAIRSIISAGFNPGERAYAAVLFAYARMSKLTELDWLLENMENGSEIVNGVAYASPSIRTYNSLKALLTKRVEQKSSVEDSYEPGDGEVLGEEMVDEVEEKRAITA